MNKSDLTNNYKDSRRIARGGSGIDAETSMS